MVFAHFLFCFGIFFGLIVLTSVFTVFLSVGLGGQGGGEDQGGAGGWERGLSKYIECKKINKKFNMCIILESKRAFIWILTSELQETVVWMSVPVKFSQDKALGLRGRLWEKMQIFKRWCRMFLGLSRVCPHKRIWEPTSQLVGFSFASLFILKYWGFLILELPEPWPKMNLFSLKLGCLRYTVIVRERD